MYSGLYHDNVLNMKTIALSVSPNSLVLSSHVILLSMMNLTNFNDETASSASSLSIIEDIISRFIHLVWLGFTLIYDH